MGHALFVYLVLPAGVSTFFSVVIGTHCMQNALSMRTYRTRMSDDLQSYLTKVGHGALSNLLMWHKEDPTMLQLVVDNTKHILRSILKALAYLHRSNIVPNYVKREKRVMQLSAWLWLCAIQCLKCVVHLDRSTTC